MHTKKYYSKTFKIISRIHIHIEVRKIIDEKSTIFNQNNRRFLHRIMY